MQRRSESIDRQSMPMLERPNQGGRIETAVRWLLACLLLLLGLG
jgi:hypothetical protein